jgi:hypothetical protein
MLDATKRLAKDTNKIANYTLAVAFVGAVVGVLTIGVLVLQAKYTGSGARVAAQTLVLAQRAYVSIQGWEGPHGKIMRWDNTSKGKPVNVSWRIRPVFVNTGATPTKNMRLAVRYYPTPHVLPAGFDFATDPPEPVVIGPKTTLAGATGVITAEQLDAVRRGDLHFYIWGDAWYKDMFPNTPEHRLSFCHRITDVLGNPLNPKTPRNTKGDDVTFTYFMHTEHNYND